MKYSRQRDLILAAVREHPVHPTADEVYAFARQTEPSISLGTVYRNLNQLCEAGLLRRVEVNHMPDRFDATLEEHYHVICEVCGKVMDVGLKQLIGIAAFVEKETGYQITGYDFTLRGRCESCCEP